MKLGHKYLEKIVSLEDTPYGWNKDDKRNYEWSKQREEYGFDERETCNLDSIFFYWLYERISMYDEISPVNTNTEFLKIRFKDKDITFQECIDFLLENCKTIILSQSLDTSIRNIEEDVLDLWSKSYKLFWW